MSTFTTIFRGFQVPQDSEQFAQLGAQITQTFGSRGWETAGFIQMGNTLVFAFQFRSEPRGGGLNELVATSTMNSTPGPEFLPATTVKTSAPRLTTKKAKKKVGKR